MPAGFAPDRHGHRRYRGSGTRGRQDLRTAVVDLEQAIASLTRARDLLTSAPTAAQDKRARETVLVHARAEAELAQRFVRDVVRGVLRPAKQRKRGRVVQMRLAL